MMCLGAGAGRLLALLLPLLVAGGPGYALDYPTRPVHFIVSFAAGGPNDTIARILGQYLSEQLGQQFIVEDHVGAGGNIGMQDVLAAAPDGYTIGFVAPNNAINATLFEHIPFDFVHDSTPIAGTMKLANVMDVNIDFPAKTLAEFIAMAKAQPGKINFASGGVGTSPHMSGELLAMMTGIKLTHVPYRGTGPAMTDLLGGQIPVLFDNLPGSMQQIKAGRIRALGVTTKERVASLPDVPTIGETVPGYEVSVWFGISGPKGIPPDIVAKLNAAINAVLANPKIKDRFHDLGGEVMPMSPAEFGHLVADETAKWAKVVKSAGLKVE
ncbi:MAG TPA: tripartite tricarboxylate transporter substrate binding protein [Xanthobacteraceae bacterium]|nr:tripartite tricarboxylate transporter substrate binding protein [Xanthobacteraceae bacterium]